MNRARQMPRLVVAGLSGDSGKTLISVGLLLEFRARGLDARAFKKGPDYIDAAWLTWASGRQARNLDTYLMDFEGALSSFTRHAAPEGLNLIEGNRGLYDGVDAQGTHSTAELAKALDAPVVLVLKATKVTRTAAALVLGCQKLDPKVNIAGVILNRVAGARHERVLRDAIESACEVPVLGVVPRAPADTLLPGRHLGLVTPEEHPGLDGLGKGVAQLLAGRLDFGRILAIARKAPPFAGPAVPALELPDGNGLKIGYLTDSAFTFYYPENLESLESAGARLVPVSALSDSRLPENVDALYIGGGFPETHAAALASNHSFLASLRDAAGAGLPVYAECGGLMLLARAMYWEGRKHPMAGVLPFDVEVCPNPQGHGYTRLHVDRENPFFPKGTVLRGHEFHYSRIRATTEAPPTACAVERGGGAVEGRDAIVVGNTWASYAHLHAAGCPEWAAGLLRVARKREFRMIESEGVIYTETMKEDRQ